MARKKKTGGTFCPSGELTIYTADENKKLLVEALDKNTELEIDLSEVSEIDTAGLQVMVLAKLESQRQDKKVSFVGHSEAVLEVLDLCKLTTFFGDPLVIPFQDSQRGKQL